MSGRTKNKKTDLSDFLRYRDDKLSGEERNSFERELQKDAFNEEAMDGLETISPDEAGSDINELRNRIERRVAGKRKYTAYRIAASIAILIGITAIILMTTRKSTPDRIAQNVIEPESLSVPENRPVIILKSPQANQNTRRKNPENNTAVVPENKKDISDTSAYRELGGLQTPAAVQNKSAEIPPTSSLSLKSAKAERALSRINPEVSVRARSIVSDRSLSRFSVKGKILSSEDNMPVPGATVVIKGTTKGVITDPEGNFNLELPDSSGRTLVASIIGMESKEFETTPDSEQIIKLNPSLTALNEVVVVGYGIRNEEENEADREGFDPPHPISGKSAFDKYILENLHRPDSLPGQKIIVVISFIVRSNGSIDNILIVRSPGKVFSDEAMRLIKSGPRWEPASKNGKPVEERVRVRLRFN